MSLKKLLIFPFCLLILLHAEEVLIKKKKQRPAEIKQGIADELGSIMKRTVELAELNAQLQRKIIDAMYDLADQADNSFFTKSSAEQLKTFNQQLAEMQGNLESSRKEMRYMINNFPGKKASLISLK